MTIITKPNAFIQIKTNMGKCPLPDETILVEEEVATVEPQRPKRRRRSSLSLAVLVMLLTMLFVTTGMCFYRRCLVPPTRYQGFCSIPIDTKQESSLLEPSFRVLPLHWSPDPDVQVFAVPGDAADYLREELDIGDTVERITVYESGRTTSFIHDFGGNFTGIVDSDRCFTMDLDPSLVLAPSAFVFHIEQGGRFELSRVRSTLRAILPALTAQVMPELCRAKPVYRLQREENIIRKRSAEEPANYIQFSGHHIHEINIENLGEIVKKETENKN